MILPRKYHANHTKKTFNFLIIQSILMLKYLLLFSIPILLIQISYSQNSSTWNKEQKTLVYTECNKELKNSGITSSDDREEFCYCYLQKLTNEFSPSDLANLIEPEQRKAFEKYYTTCSSETGVRFNYSATNNPSYSNTGAWSRDKRDDQYKKCQKDLFAQNYKVTLEEQEEFCLCYLDKLTQNHSSFEVDNMIRPELKRMQNQYFNACSGETGISLSTNNAATTVLEIFTGDWDRQKKDIYYSSCENDLQNNGNNYTKDQVEEFCLCYVDKLSHRYSARELEEMIRPELKRIKERIYSNCTSKTEVGTMALENNMLGRWESSTGEVLVFKEGGQLRYIYENNDMDENWTWKYKPGDILSFTSDGIEIEYKVLYIKDDYIKYTPKKHSTQIYEYYKK
ncbi:MAG: Unknown protein [uncultured Aureispira sp.]|uniref:Uncharacterized protein n=1 Tax=uncultured Aureispira sp. TaxID=1331704 RepID=A0A6S6TDA2_9BACT|nr:MAG: Unknown protein [uncultured Aureispira sp.]